MFPVKRQDPKKRAIAALPPTFRQAEHELTDKGLVTTWTEQDLRPGQVITAADRAYVAGVSGELRRVSIERGRAVVTSPRAKPVKPETRAAAKHRDRIEAKLAEAEESRKRRSQSRQDRRKQAQPGQGATNA